MRGVWLRHDDPGQQAQIGCTDLSDMSEDSWLLHIVSVMDSQTAVEVAERTAVELGHAVSCFVASVLIVSENRGQLLLHCCRPVDELFLRAVQQRTLSSYQLCVGAASAAPTIQVTVRGDSVSGPYEPPRSILTMPIMVDKRIAGIMAVASVFPDAFDSDDLCKMSAVSARASAYLRGKPRRQ